MRLYPLEQKPFARYSVFVVGGGFAHSILVAHLVEASETLYTPNLAQLGELRTHRRITSGGAKTIPNPRHVKGLRVRYAAL